MNEDAPRHPGAQTMAAFLDGRLPQNEIAVVADHLSQCGECRTVIAETAEFEREEESRSESPRRSRAWWLLAAAALAIGVVAIPYFWPRDPIAQLVQAAPTDHRLVKPRLARFRWAPL